MTDKTKTALLWLIALAGLFLGGLGVSPDFVDAFRDEAHEQIDSIEAVEVEAVDVDEGTAEGIED